VGSEDGGVGGDVEGSSNLQTRCLRGDVVDQIFARQSSTGTAWLLTDRLGSVVDVTDGSGVLQDTIVYDAFGNVLSQTNSSETGRYQWTGRESDPTTMLQYNRGRYYDSSTGRWISQDPLGFDPGDSNLYRYANNNYTTDFDPSGLRLIDVKVAAYIGKHIGGPWLQEPDLRPNPWQFETDFREPGKDFNKSRIKSEFEVDPNKLGNYKDFSAVHSAGTSVRYKLGDVPKLMFGQRNGKKVLVKVEKVPGKIYETKTTKVKGTASFENFGMGSTKFKITNAGNYPFVPLSPNIDYTLSLVFTKVGVDVEITGVFYHDYFPDYEVIINGKVFSYPTNDKGPGIVNLNSGKTEQIKWLV